MHPAADSTRPAASAPPRQLLPPAVGYTLQTRGVVSLNYARGTGGSHGVFFTLGEAF